MTREHEKQQAARKALEFIEDKTVIGVGTGSTVEFFIQELASMRHRIEGAVSSSERTTQALKRVGVSVLDLNSVGEIPLYVDGADECDPHKRLIKGGGGALTREKIIAAASKKFVCLIDSGKQVKLLGKFPLPVEVIPMARSYVARELVKLGGQPIWRDRFTTDNGNWILDVHNLSLIDPVAVENSLNQITGMVCHGLFAKRAADIVICADRVI